MFNADFEKIHVSNKTESALNFGSPTLKRQVVNLHKLFGIVVQTPFLRPAVNPLISMPLTWLYTWLFFAFYGYKTLRSYSSMVGFFRTIGHYIAFYFKYVSRLEKRSPLRSAASIQSYPSKRH